jgi:hypothetical protein
VFARWQFFLVLACLIATVAANIFASNAGVPILEGNWTVIRVDAPMGNNLTRSLIPPGKTFRIDRNGSMIGEREYAKDRPDKPTPGSFGTFTGIVGSGKCRAYCFTLVDIATNQEFEAILSSDKATLNFTGSKGIFFTARRQ